MKDFDINSIWEKQELNLDSDLQLNPKSLKTGNFKKVRSRVRSLLIRRSVETVIFVLLAFFLVRFAVANSQPHFIAAGVVLTIFALTGATGSIWQLVTIFRLDYSEPVTEFQLKLEKLRSYSLRTLQLLLLSIPFYMAYIIIGFKAITGFDIVGNATTEWLISNAVLTILAFPLAFYLFSKLSLNTGNNRIKRFIADNGGKEIDSAMRSIKELISFEDEEAVPPTTL